jgi:hypothetical protein
MATPTIKEWISALRSNIHIKPHSNTITPTINDWIAFLKMVEVSSSTDLSLPSWCPSDVLVETQLRAWSEYPCDYTRVFEQFAQSMLEFQADKTTDNYYRAAEHMIVVCGEDLVLWDAFECLVAEYVGRTVIWDGGGYKKWEFVMLWVAPVTMEHWISADALE